MAVSSQSMQERVLYHSRIYVLYVQIAGYIVRILDLVSLYARRINNYEEDKINHSGSCKE
jgi:hypothetical protein